MGIDENYGGFTLNKMESCWSTEVGKYDDNYALQSMAEQKFLDWNLASSDRSAFAKNTE